MLDIPLGMSVCPQMHLFLCATSLCGNTYGALDSTAFSPFVSILRAGSWETSAYTQFVVSFGSFQSL